MQGGPPDTLKADQMWQKMGHTSYSPLCCPTHREVQVLTSFRPDNADFVGLNRIKCAKCDSDLVDVEDVFDGC